MNETIPEPPTLFDDYANRCSAASMATMRIADELKPARDLMLFSDDSPTGRNLFARMSPSSRRAWHQAFDEENARYRDDRPSGKDKIRWRYQRYIKNYLRCIASVDDSVGRIIEALDDRGLTANTIIVYMSDQGFYLGEHGWFDKRFMYEQSLRTPLIIRWPQVLRPGQVDDHIVSNVDIAETFLDAAGLDIPTQMQGRSLLPLLKGNAPDGWRKSFYYQYYEGPPAIHTVAEHYGVTTGHHKLIHYHQLGQWELFDLAKDPHELRSLYGNPEYAGIQAKLKKELRRRRAKLGIHSDSHPSEMK